MAISGVNGRDTSFFSFPSFLRDYFCFPFLSWSARRRKDVDDVDRISENTSPGSFFSFFPSFVLSTASASEKRNSGYRTQDVGMCFYDEALSFLICYLRLDNGTVESGERLKGYFSWFRLPSIPPFSLRGRAS